MARLVHLLIAVIMTVMAVSCNAALSDEEYADLFAKFVFKYNKTYSNKVFARRFPAFRKNIDKIVLHNSKLSSLSPSAGRYAVTSLTDLPASEFAARLQTRPFTAPGAAAANGTANASRSNSTSSSGASPSNSTNNTAAASPTPPALESSGLPVGWGYSAPPSPSRLPDAYDPRTAEHDALSPSAGALLPPIEDQGDTCGAGWAYAAATALAGYEAQAKKAPARALSAAELISCVTGNNGCLGEGYIESAFQYVSQRANGKLSTKDAFPSVVDGQKESKGKCGGALLAGGERMTAETKNFTTLAPLPGAEEPVVRLTKALLATPVAVTIKGSALQFVGADTVVGLGGECSEAAGEVNHAVTVVGFKNDAEVPYFIVANSWGTGWGDKGYFKVAQNASHDCGLFASAVHPRVV